jgi:hypothetical protein
MAVYAHAIDAVALRTWRWRLKAAKSGFKKSKLIVTNPPVSGVAEPRINNLAPNSSDSEMAHRGYPSKKVEGGEAG